MTPPSDPDLPNVPDIPDVPTTDLLGRETTADERELMALYGRLKTLAVREDLAPCALMNVRQAMVMLWNACVDLDLVYEEV